MIIFGSRLMSILNNVSPSGLLQEGEVSITLIAGYFIVIMFVSALNAKALGASIVAALGILAVYPDEETSTVIFLLYAVAVVLAAFRD